MRSLLAFLAFFSAAAAAPPVDAVRYCLSSRAAGPNDLILFPARKCQAIIKAKGKALSGLHRQGVINTPTQFDDSELLDGAQVLEAIARKEFRQQQYHAHPISKVMILDNLVENYFARHDVLYSKLTRNNWLYSYEYHAAVAKALSTMIGDCAPNMASITDHMDHRHAYSKTWLNDLFYSRNDDGEEAAVSHNKNPSKQKRHVTFEEGVRTHPSVSSKGFTTPWRCPHHPTMSIEKEQAELNAIAQRDFELDKLALEKIVPHTKALAKVLSNTIAQLAKSNSEAILKVLRDRQRRVKIDMELSMKRLERFEAEEAELEEELEQDYMESYINSPPGNLDSRFEEAYEDSLEQELWKLEKEFRDKLKQEATKATNDFYDIDAVNLSRRPVIPPATEPFLDPMEEASAEEEEASTAVEEEQSQDLQPRPSEADFLCLVTGSLILVFFGGKWVRAKFIRYTRRGVVFIVCLTDEKRCESELGRFRIL